MLALLIALALLARARWRRAREHEDDTLPRLVIPVAARPLGEAARPPREPEPVAVERLSAPVEPMRLGAGYDGNGDGYALAGGQDRTITFRRPADAQMQILPARLDVVEGPMAGEQIRLVRLLGEPVQITFGRSEGPPHRHVTLRSATVSRMHAVLAFTDGRWTVANLSHTNPVVVNGAPLADPDDVRELADGDRIEMGEVVCRFHAR